MTTSPALLVERTRELVARRRRRFGFALALAALPVLGLVAVVVDASAGLPTWLRVVVSLGLLASSLGLAMAMAALWRLLQPDAARARLLAEQALGDEHRHLTTALELATMPGALAGRAAEQFSASLPGERLDPGLPVVRVKRVVAAAGAALVLALIVHVAWPTVFPAVLPRLYDPFGDHPPWSRTTLALVEPPARVRPPVTPRLVVRAEGPPPKELRLHAEDANGRVVTNVVMLAIGGDQWAASLAPLTSGDVGVLASPLRVWVSGAGTRTHYHALAIDPVPSLTGGTLTHSSPAYARLPEMVAKLNDGAATIRALPGSRVTVQPQANRPLRGVEVLRDGTSVRVESATTVTLDDPTTGTWTLVLEAEDGIRSEPLPLMTVVARTDEPPNVRFEQPASDGVATPDMFIPLGVRAEDDLGLVRLTRYRLRNDQRETEGRDQLGGTSDTWRGRLSTGGAHPGDVIRVGVVATDTRPPDGQVSAPAERTISIISHGDYNALVMERIDEHALEQKYGDLLARIAELEQAIAEASQAPASPERSAKLDALAERAAELKREVGELRRPEPLFAIEPHLQDELERHLTALEQHAHAAKEQAQSGPTPEAAKKMQQDLATMTAQAEAEALREHLRDLAKAQRQAADELADLKQHGIRNDADRARLREASRQQQEMEQALKDWQEAARDVGQRLEQAKPEQAKELQELAEQVAQCDAERLVSQASRAARAGKAGDAHGDAEEAARRLAGIAGDGFGEGPGQGDKPGWCQSDAYARCLSQLQGLAKRGYNPGASDAGTGGGATGARGGGMLVRRGGRSRPNGAPLELFGPEALTALSGSRSGQQQTKATANGTEAAASEARAATAYATGTRATTAGVGATFTPGEQVLIEDYFRRLDAPAAGVDGGVKPEAEGRKP